MPYLWSLGPALPLVKQLKLTIDIRVGFFLDFFKRRILNAMPPFQLPQRRLPYLIPTLNQLYAEFKFKYPDMLEIIVSYKFIQ